MVDDDLEMDETLSAKPYAGFHQRIVHKPLDKVWPACLEVTAEEVRLFGPLMAVRTIPHRIRHRRTIVGSEPKPLLDVFADAGFVILRRDGEPRDGRAVAMFGAVGRFWSVSGNAPVPFESPQDFLDFDTAGYAKTVARLEAVDLGDGTTRVETETWVNGTDPGSTAKFGPYWMVIRAGSGLIRRSWLAAIDRRAQR